MPKSPRMSDKKLQTYVGKTFHLMSMPHGPFFKVDRAYRAYPPDTQRS